MENQLTKGVTDLLTKSASLTAERMAARLEKVAASGSNLVSDMSATVAAGRDKVTDVLSRYTFCTVYYEQVLEKKRKFEIFGLKPLIFHLFNSNWLS